MLVTLWTDRNTHRAKQAGFTVLELMVATTIFAIVLMVLTVGVLSFSRDYFSSVTRSNTQTVARAIMDDIAKTIQFGQTVPQSGVSGGTQVLCIDNVEYLYTIGTQVSTVVDSAKHQGKYGLVKRVPASACGSSAPDITSGAAFFNSSTDKELLAKNMRLSDLSVTPAGTDTFTIRVRVAYGDDDLLGVTPTTSVWNTLSCKSGSGSQFCAVSDLSTTVQQRIIK